MDLVHALTDNRACFPPKIDRGEVALLKSLYSSTLLLILSFTNPRTDSNAAKEG